VEIKLQKAITLSKFGRHVEAEIAIARVDTEVDDGDALRLVVHDGRAADPRFVLTSAEDQEVRKKNFLLVEVDAFLPSGARTPSRNFLGQFQTITSRSESDDTEVSIAPASTLEAQTTSGRRTMKWCENFCGVLDSRSITPASPR
jgi:hypothetical protein